MNDKNYEKCGKILLLFSIILAILYIFVTFYNMNVITFNDCLKPIVLSIIIIFSGIRLKEKYPKYYIYQIYSGLIVIVTTLISTFILNILK